jgi:phage gp29-like protein
MGSVTLYDQFNRKINLSQTKTPDKTPLGVAPMLDSFREYVTEGLTPERLAKIYKAADTGDMRSQAELFELLEEKDGHLLCERDKRKNVILDLDFKVEPATEDAKGQQVADFVQKTLDGMADLDESILSMQDAVGKGYAAQEINWDVSEGQAVPIALEFLEQKRCTFMDPKGLLQKFPRLVTDEDSMGMEIPAWKVLFHQYGGKSGHPTRSGIYRVASWMVLFKNYAIKDWVIFCEIFGMPLRLGKYDQGASDPEKDALRRAITSLGSDAAGIISKSTEIEFVQNVTKGTSDLYKLLASFCNGEISKAILGQTLTTDVDGKGSYAASKTHNEVRLDLLRADGRAIASTIRDQLIRPLVGFNFGWDTALPKYKAIFKEPEDLVAKSEWMGNMLAHLRMPVSFVNRSFSIPDREGEEEMVGGPVTVEPLKTESAKIIVAKDSTNKDQIDILTEKTLAQGSMEELLQPVKDLLDQVDSLEAFRDGLLALYGAMDTTALADVMQQAFALAELAGRFDVEAENGL